MIATALPLGAEAALLSDEKSRAVVETVHREHAPDAWRETLAAERAKVSMEDVMVRLGVNDEAGVYDHFRQGHLARDLNYERLIAGVMDEIAIERAQSKLPQELWRRANQEVSA